MATKDIYSSNELNHIESSGPDPDCLSSQVNLWTSLDVLIEMFFIIPYSINICNIENFLYLLQVFISYINLIDDTGRRHYEQDTFWNFKCQCLVCKDEFFDKQKHSFKCDSCKNIRPIDVKEWELFNLESAQKKKYNWCDCVIPDDDHATDQDIRLYKYLWNNVSKLRACDKVDNTFRSIFRLAPVIGIIETILWW